MKLKEIMIELQSSLSFRGFMLRGFANSRGHLKNKNKKLLKFPEHSRRL